MKLREVTPRAVSDFFHYELEKGKVSQKDGSLGPLAPRTVREFRNILKLAYNQAIIDGLVKSNPCLEVHVRGRNLRSSNGEYLFLSEKEATELLDFLKSNHPFLMPIAFFGIYYGLRRSEILGLHWFNIDCILSIGNPQNCHQNSLFLEREFLVVVRTRFLHSGVLSGASMHAASDNFSRRT